MGVPWRFPSMEAAFEHANITSHGNANAGIRIRALYTRPCHTPSYWGCEMRIYEAKKKLLFLSRRAKLVPSLAETGCRVVSATDPHGHRFSF
jgi:hypothetical protein